MPEVDRTYGTVDYDADTKSYVVDGEPMVLEMAKRLFPGSRATDVGVRFPAIGRTVGELNWLMLRYPLVVKCTERFEADRAKAIEHADRRKRNQVLKPMATDQSTFLGKLFPYQEEAVAFLIENERCLLADDMGLGKTISALGAAAKLGKYPVLIVVEPHVRRQWRRMVGRFMDVRVKTRAGRSKRTLGQQLIAEPESTLTRGDTREEREARAEHMVHIVKGLTPYKLPNVPFIVIHYGLLDAWKQALETLAPRVVIFDEIQALRHIKTGKYTAAEVISQQAEYVWGLSGTPIYGHGVEIHSVMNIISYHCLSDRDSFTMEWCDGYGEKRVKNPKLLGKFLREEGLMLRRTKKQVGAQLPPKRRVVQEIGSDQSLFMQHVQEAIALAHGYHNIKNWHAKGQANRKIEGEVRKATGRAKAPFVVEFVRGLVMAGERVLLGAHHHEVHDVLQKGLADLGVSRLTGKETDKQKEEAIEQFITGKTKVALLALRSSAGLDGLQEVGTVACAAELDWSPAVHAQFEDRLHRTGLKGKMESLMCYYLVASGGHDETVQEALGLKAGQFKGIVENEDDEAPPVDADEEGLQAAERHFENIIARLKAHPNPSDFIVRSCSSYSCDTLIIKREDLAYETPTGRSLCKECDSEYERQRMLDQDKWQAEDEQRRAKLEQLDQQATVLVEGGLA